MEQKEDIPMKLTSREMLQKAGIPLIAQVHLNDGCMGSTGKSQMMQIFLKWNSSQRWITTYPTGPRYLIRDTCQLVDICVYIQLSDILRSKK